MIIVDNKFKNNVISFLIEHELIYKTFDLIYDNELKNFKVIKLNKDKLISSKKWIHDYLNIINLFLDLNYLVIIDDDWKIIHKLKKEGNYIIKIKSNRQLNKFKNNFDKLRYKLNKNSKYECIYGIQFNSIDFSEDINKSSKINLTINNHIEDYNVVNLLREYSTKEYYLTFSTSLLELPYEFTGERFTIASSLEVIYNFFKDTCSHLNIFPDNDLTNVEVEPLKIGFDDDSYSISGKSFKDILNKFAKLMLNYKDELKRMPSNLHLEKN